MIATHKVCLTQAPAHAHVCTHAFTQNCNSYREDANVATVSTKRPDLRQEADDSTQSSRLPRCRRVCQRVAPLAVRLIQQCRHHEGQSGGVNHAYDQGVSRVSVPQHDGRPRTTRSSVSKARNDTRSTEVRGVSDCNYYWTLSSLHTVEPSNPRSSQVTNDALRRVEFDMTARTRPTRRYSTAVGYLQPANTCPRPRCTETSA